jgi:transcriptional regulator with GAF, ATPase, and Fis domain
MTAKRRGQAEQPDTADRRERAVGPGGAARQSDDLDAAPGTVTHDEHVVEPARVRRLRLTQLEGPQPSRTWESTSDRCTIGAHPRNDVVIDDPTVSRFHCAIELDATSAVLRDVGSHNGTLLDGVRVIAAVPRSGSLVQMGRVTFRLELGSREVRLPLSSREELGPLLGRSIAMRQLFALLERAAASDANILLEGETGTGKSLAARAVHEASARRGAPFVVVDCAALPAQILDSELFGHEAGAFTGAVARRIGAFEEAAGGTVLIDELGELPPELQPKLLRVIEERVVRRVGSNRAVPVDVRILAATNRDLRVEVNAGRFRSDLFFRVGVVCATVPPLRRRLDDLPVLVERLLGALAARPEQAAALLSPAFLASLRRSSWPGNVRELRNHVERHLVLEDALEAADDRGASDGGPTLPYVDARLPYAEARRRAMNAFEREYARALVDLHGGRVAGAASAAGIDRAYLHRLLKRHGVKP